MPFKLSNFTQTLQKTTRQGVGTSRWQRPVYKNLLPPCNKACPAGEDIQGWLSLAQAGDYKKAWQALVINNPFPAVHGRACYHPCETICNRGDMDAPVSIHAVERFLGDMAVEEAWQVPAAATSGKRVLVVGAGPAGLSCAYHLARLGHEVEIHDEAERPGGMMQYGIPAYRLPRNILDHEVARVIAMPGITLKCGQRVEDLARAKADGKFDAVFVAVGAQLANNMQIPSIDGSKLVDAIGMLNDVSQGKRPQLGKAVAVVGGGNVAMDAARTAKRLGATETILIYRRGKDQMPAQKSEAEEAFAEGVKVRWFSVVDQFGADSVAVEKVEMGADGSLKKTGDIEYLNADSIILAVGQSSDLSLLKKMADVEIKRDGTVAVNTRMMTTHDGVFAGGDCVGGLRTMTAATGHGKRAAYEIDAYLYGQHHEHPTPPPVVDFSMLHLPDYMDAAPHLQKELDLEYRSDFAEVVSTLRDSDAQLEAQRCLSCGNCYECDNCFASCPEQAITRLGSGLGYAVSLDLCTGCAACFEQCPCRAIEMEAEVTTVDAATIIAPAGFKIRS